MHPNNSSYRLTQFEMVLVLSVPASSLQDSRSILSMKNRPGFPVYKLAAATNHWANAGAPCLKFAIFVHLHAVRKEGRQVV